jgi:outer membrane usher protein
MSARNSRFAAKTIFLGVIVLFLELIPASALTPEDDQRLLLAVVINNHPTNKVGEFVQRRDALFARPEDLRSLGIRVAESVAVSNEGLVALSGLPAAFRLDRATQTLYVTAENDGLLPQVLNSGALPDGAYSVESGIGLTINYDVYGNDLAGGFSGSGLTELRAFAPWGVLSSGLLVYPGGHHEGFASEPAVRLDSTWVYSDTETLRRYRAGDFISGYLPWTRAVRLGGIQVTKDFSMRPDLVTFPVPSLSGAVAVPSTVDVLVNGTRVLSDPVQPGPFQVPQLPVTTGQGTISMTVTDALGQQVTTELPFYASSDLLAPGLQTWSADFGFIRNDWGVISNDYGSAAGLVTWRRGLTPALTLEAHGEGSRGLYMAGVGGVIGLGDFAVANLSAAGSTVSGHSGAQVSAGIQHIGQRLSFGVSALFASHDFADVAAVNGEPITLLQVTASAGLSLGRWGSFGLAYASFDRAARSGRNLSGLASEGNPPLSQGGLPDSFFDHLSEHAQIVSGSYSVQFGRVFLFANAFHDFDNRHSNAVSIGVSIPLGSRTTASASVQSDLGSQSYQAEVSQSATTVGEWGYRAFASMDHPDHEFAQASYMSPWALVAVGVDRFGSKTTVQADAHGAVSFVDHGVFLSNQIDDSFAVVDTNGIAGIEVRQENRYAGRTDTDGRVLVPDLRSFEINHLSIEPRDAPIDATVPFASREVRPQDRSGVVVKFPVRISNGGLLKLTDSAGAPIPVGSVATLHSTEVAVPVGYDGEAYVVDLRSHNEVSVEEPDGRRCDVTFDYQRVPDKLVTIGPLVCREAQQ